eukprot:227170-Lingulodinium_polyedra.AAC.1
MPGPIASNNDASRAGSTSRSKHAGKARPSFSRMMASLRALPRAIAATRTLAASSPCCPMA